MKQVFFQEGGFSNGGVSFWALKHFNLQMGHKYLLKKAVQNFYLCLNYE